MIMKEFVWEFDPFGTNPKNKITEERQVITEINGTNFRYFVPKAAPFFEEEVKVKHVASGVTLTPGVDYQFGLSYNQATQQVMKPVYGSISILNSQYTGTFEIEYHTMGGEFTLDTQTITEILINLLYDPRTVSWDRIVDPPAVFPPIHHQQPITDFVNYNHLVAAMEALGDKVLESYELFYPAFTRHLEDRSNPHGVTKADIGLPLTPNARFATLEEAADGARFDVLMSPRTVSEMITRLNKETLVGHVADKNNPHAVTKDQVELGLVPNAGWATDAEAIDKNNFSSFLNPAQAWKAVKAWIVDAFALHLADHDNPHHVNKNQLGLGLTPNLPLANDQQAGEAATDDGLLTPRLGKVLFDALSQGYKQHVENRNNPHGVTAEHVQLGLVPNAAWATELQAMDPQVQAAFMNPKLVHLVANALIKVHADLANPHNTSKKDVGLEFTPNAAWASAQQIVGTDNEPLAFVNQVVMREAIALMQSETVAGHAANRDNPHGVTKKQVGLEFTPNYPAATEADLDNPLADACLTSVKDVYRIIGKTSNTTVEFAANDTEQKYQKLFSMPLSATSDVLLDAVGTTAPGAGTADILVRISPRDGGKIEVIERDAYPSGSEWGVVVTQTEVELWIRSVPNRVPLRLTQRTPGGSFASSAGVVPKPLGYAVVVPQNLYATLLAAHTGVVS